MDKCVILPRRDNIEVPSDSENGKKEVVLAGATSASDEWEEIEEDDQVVSS